MSDDTRFSVVVCEGVHDVRAICRILGIKGFREARELPEVPPSLQNTIPRQYPLRNKGTELTWLVAHPAFLHRGDYWILVCNANGESELGANLRTIFDSLRKEYIDTAMRGAAVLADADAAGAPEKKGVIARQLADAFRADGKYAFEVSAPGHIRLFGNARPFAMYIFPDDRHPGTLEKVLLEGAQKEYAALLGKAKEYVAYAKTLSYAEKLSRNSNGDKATVGVIANALRPGKANQVSIQDDKWFTEESLAALPLHKSLSDFTDLIIGWENN